MQNELVSVIIPTFKRSQNLERAINSVLSQTYKMIEIIVIDDNVSDSEFRKSTEILMRKYEKVKNIKYIKNKKNCGGGVARNRGIKVAKGKYISFLDDDDIFFPDKIQKEMSIFKNREDINLGIVYSYCEARHIDGKFLKVYNKKLGDKKLLFKHMKNNIAATTQIMVKKKVLKEIGYFEDTLSKQDYLLILKILGARYDILCTEEIMSFFYEHNGDRISKPSYQKIKDELFALQFSKKYFNQLCKNEKKEVQYFFYKRAFELSFLIEDNSLKFKFFIKLFKNRMKFDKNLLLIFIKLVLPSEYYFKLKGLL